MRMPSALRSLDDRVLGRKGAGTATADDGPPTERAPRAEPGERRPRGDGVGKVIAAVGRVSRLVFLLLAAAVLLGLLFVLAPTNDQNSVVELVSSLAEKAAGPFRDVFTLADADRQTVVNYGFAAAVYVLASVLVTKLPGRKT